MTASSDEDFDIDALDDDFDLGGFRERRLEELKREMEKSRLMQQEDYGKITEIKDEKELMKLVAKTKLAIVHFYHKDFRRCAVMDSQLEKLAPTYFATKFLKTDVANAPFLVVKLDIKVLPCVVCFIDGVSKDRIVGFEGLTPNNADTFTLAQLEFRLKQSGVLSKENFNARSDQVARRDSDDESDRD